MFPYRAPIEPLYTSVEILSVAAQLSFKAFDFVPSSLSSFFSCFLSESKKENVNDMSNSTRGSVDPEDVLRDHQCGCRGGNRFKKGGIRNLTKKILISR